MSSYKIANNADLEKLESHFKDNLYVGGNFPNAEDALLFQEYASSNTEPNQATHPNLWSWFALISLYTPPVRESWKQLSTKKEEPKKTEVKKPEPKKAEPKKEEPKKDEDIDLFGDDDEADAAALEAMKKKKAEEKKKDKKKDEVVQKSLVILDVKVWDPEQDYDALAKKIIQIEKDGLFWKTEYQLKDVAFGVKKIVIGLVVEDEKVSVDDVIDEIQSWEDEVQSVDIVAFNKI